MGALLDATELTAVRLCGAGGIPTPTACVQEKKYCLYTLRRTAQGLYTQPGKSQGEEGTAQPGAGERAQHWHTDTGRQNTLLQAEQLLLKLKATNTHTHTECFAAQPAARCSRHTSRHSLPIQLRQQRRSTGPLASTWRLKKQEGKHKRATNSAWLQEREPLSPPAFLPARRGQAPSEINQIPQEWFCFSSTSQLLLSSGKLRSNQPTQQPTQPTQQPTQPPTAPRELRTHAASLGFLKPLVCFGFVFSFPPLC